MKFIKTILLSFVFVTDIFASNPYNHEFKIGYLHEYDSDYYITDILSLPNSNFVVGWVANNQLDYTYDWKGYTVLLSNIGEPEAEPAHIFTTSEFSTDRDIRLLNAQNKYLESDFFNSSRNFYSIHNQFYNYDNKPIGPSFSINTLSSGRILWEYHTIILQNGNVVVAWSDIIESHTWYQRFFKIFSPTGDVVMETKSIDKTRSGEEYLFIQSLPSNNFVIAWGDGGCHVQIFSSEGVLQHECLVASASPMNLCVLKNGSFLLIYEGAYSQSKPSDGVFVQLFDKNGEKNGQRIELSGWVTKYFQDEPSSTELTDGKVILSWIEYTENIGWHGCYQILSSNGEPIGSELSVTSGSFEAQTVHALPDGRFIIVWESSYNIFARFFDGNGNPESVGFKVNDANGSQQMGSRVASGFGKIFLGWNSDQENGSNYEVYGKIFPEKPQIHQLKPFVMLSPYPDNTLNENKTVFYWRRASEEQVAFPWEIVYNVVLSKNEDFSQPRVVTVQADTMVEIQNLDWGESYYWKVCAKNIAGDSLWSGNTIQFYVPKKTGVESVYKELPDKFELHQNYPNPFNPETTIRFDLPASGLVEISIYNISGKLVRELMKESRTAGSHSVKWNGKNSKGDFVPSGIYICRISIRSADGRKSILERKMSLVK